MCNGIVFLCFGVFLGIYRVVLGCFIGDVLYKHAIFGDPCYEGDTFNLPRNTKDIARYNTFGVSLMELCCLYDIHILNGRTTGDINGEITCTANEGCSTVEYNIASSDLFKHVERFSVENMDYSVHFPLSCTLLFKLAVVSPITDKNSKKDYNKSQIRYKWTEEKSIIFYDKFVDLLN